jgi:hypothetical protein
MVRRVALDHLIGVRIPVSQPIPFLPRNRPHNLTTHNRKAETFQNQRW